MISDKEFDILIRLSEKKIDDIMNQHAFPKAKANDSLVDQSPEALRFVQPVERTHHQGYPNMILEKDQLIRS